MAFRWLYDYEGIIRKRLIDIKMKHLKTSIYLITTTEIQMSKLKKSMQIFDIQMVNNTNLLKKE